ncbi:MAG: hypothetical protein OQK76_00600 [Gammaproteobacteria bacterium]|nr:hypothetical protein [Gammaproteobacteria bacterium]
MNFRNYGDWILKTRLVAAGSHFLVSAFVISLFLCVVYFIWYPEPFHRIHSVFDAVKIALVVDLVLGPFLTLVVFNTLKPRSELIRDLSIIVLLQISALAWGVHITHKVRPVFLVFQGDTFYSIIKEDIKLENLNKNLSLPAIWQQPEWIYIEPLSSEKAIQNMDYVTRGEKIKGEMYKAEKYRPLTLQMSSIYMQDILKHSMSGSKLLTTMNWSDSLKEFLRIQNGKVEDYLFYPMINPGKFDGIIVFDKKDFSFVGLIN